MSPFSEHVEHLTRRHFLKNCQLGLGAIALGSLLGDDATAKAVDPLAPKKPHFAPKARSVIFLFMDGGVSQVDSFDPKPQLDKEHGQKPKFKTDATVFNAKGNLMASPWKFRRDTSPHPIQRMLFLT